MRIFILVCVSSGLCLLTNAQTYSLSGNPVDWSQAGSTCTPATPIIWYSSIYNQSFWFRVATENSPQIDEDEAWVGYLDEEKVWVGYYASNHLFKYEANTNTSVQDWKPPGDCVSYRPDGNAGEWFWTPCDFSLFVLCEDDNSLELTNVKDWLESSNSCFSSKQLPASVLNETISITAHTNIDDPSLYWTGLFRDTVIHTFKETGSVAPEQYGYLEDDDGIVYLKFTSDTGEQPNHRVLCEQGVAGSTTELANAAVNTTTTTAMTTTADTVPVIVGTCAGVLVLTVFVVFAVILYKRRKNSQNTPNNKSGTISKTDNVINIDYLDNSLSEEIHPPNNLHDYPYAQVQKKKKNTNKSLARDSDISTDTSKVGERHSTEHVYYTVDPTGGDEYNTAHAKSVLPQHKDTSNPYNTLALESESDTYDHTGSRPPIAKSTNNIYNVADTYMEEGDVKPYDVLGAKSKVQEVRDNVYNTTQEIADKDSVYDKTNIVKRSEDKLHTDNVYDTTQFDNGESVYDKTNINPKQTHIVDNIYNKTEA